MIVRTKLAKWTEQVWEAIKCPDFWNWPPPEGGPDPLRDRNLASEALEHGHPAPPSPPSPRTRAHPYPLGWIAAAILLAAAGLFIAGAAFGNGSGARSGIITDEYMGVLPMDSMNLRPGVVLTATSFTHNAGEGFKLSYKTPKPTQRLVFLFLGITEPGEQFDADAALRSFGWIPIDEHERALDAAKGDE